jgi:hypothetical protein
MLFLAKNYFTDNALWAGALFWCKLHPFIHNFSRFFLARSRNFVKILSNTANLPSGRWVPILQSQYPGYQRKQHDLEIRKTFFLVSEMTLASTALIVAWFPDHT